MKLGKIVGKVWATQKDEQLNGVKLYVMQPLDEHLTPKGRPLIAADAIGSGQGDIVYWVSSREATYAFEDKKIPSDVTIVGIVDSSHIASRESIDERKQTWASENIVKR